jgi:disulfide bond formation protein DsbB
MAILGVCGLLEDGRYLLRIRALAMALVAAGVGAPMAIAAQRIALLMAIASCSASPPANGHLPRGSRCRQPAGAGTAVPRAVRLPGRLAGGLST